MKKKWWIAAGFACLAAAALAQEAGGSSLPFKDVEAAASAGAADAQFELGMRYLRGDGVLRDAHAGVGWLERAAAQGHVQANRFLGLLYLEGISVEKDFARARSYFSAAADRGDADALQFLGGMAAQGRGQDKDLDAAERLYREAVAKGSTSAMASLGALLVGSREHPGRAPGEGLVWLRRGAEQGDASCAYLLHYVYREGVNVPRDEHEALGWLQVAAKGGLAQAQFVLGSALRSGAMGVPKDPREAYLWLSLAARTLPAALVIRSDVEKGLTPNEIAEIQQQLRDWKPTKVTAVVKAGRVPLADLHIEPTFATQEITRENFGAVARACLPTYPDSAVQRIVASWDFPRRNSITTIRDAKTAGAIGIRETTAFCVHESEAGYPVLAAESFRRTIEPEGVPEAVRDDWFAQIAKLIATKGYAEVVYQFPNGNGFTTLYRSVPGAPLQVEYRTAFHKAGEYDPAKYDAVFTHPDMKSISTTRYGASQEKFVLLHRFRPGPASGLPLGVVPTVH